VTYDDGPTITYTYDNAGNLLKRVMLAKVNLADVIYALQVLSGIEPSSPVYKEADLNADGKIGLEEVVYILQELSGLSIDYGFSPCSDPIPTLGGKHKEKKRGQANNCWLDVLNRVKRFSYALTLEN